MTELTSDHLAELKAVAEAANAGPWRENGSLFQVAETGSGIGQVWGLNWRSDLAHIAAFDPPTVLSLIAALEAKTAEVEGCKQRFSCDGGCSYGDGPQEECSLHGRKPRDLWEIVGGLARERDEARATAEDHVLDADATYVRMAEKLEQVKRERDAAQLVMNTHSCGENVEAAYRRTVEAERERDEARAEVERVRELHAKKEVEAVTGECADDTCEHEDNCPTHPFEVCIACWNLCEESYPYFGELGISQVLYPCPTIQAFEGENDE